MHERESSSMKNVQAILNDCLALNHPLAGPGLRYLQSRGLRLDGDYSALLFHRGLRYFEAGRSAAAAVFPAVIGKCVNAKNEITAIQRIFVTEEGEKASVDSPKKALGALKGSVVWLSPLSGEEVHIAEGIETALAILQVVKGTVIAAVNANNLSAFDPPASVRIVRIWTDKDRSLTGQKAGLALARKMAASGRIVFIHEPVGELQPGEKSLDWLDVFRLQGEAPFYESLRVTLAMKLKSEDPPLDPICLADITAEVVEWLWYPYLAVGKISMIEGDPGLGKSTITLAIAAHVSLGYGLPDVPRSDPRNALLLTCEDGLADTIKPRLNKLNADHARIFAPSEKFSFDAEGMAELRRLLFKLEPAIVIIDPLVAYLGESVDLHRSNETRPVMAELAAMAEEFKCVILMLRHLTKGGASKAIYRGLGSIDLTGACRSVLLVGADANDSKVRAVIHIKSNLAEHGPSQGYEITEGIFNWTGESTMTAGDVLKDAAPTGKGGKSAVDEAADFIRDFLALGPRPSKELEAAGAEAGHSKASIIRARKKLNIVPVRMGETADGVPIWLSKLADPPVVVDLSASGKDAQHSHTESVSALNVLPTDAEGEA